MGGAAQRLIVGQVKLERALPERHIGRQVRGPRDEIFTLTDYLGRGAFGEVYRAVGGASGAIVAVKILYEGEFGEAEAVQSLRNEAKLAAQVNHPNVVQVLHSGSDPDLGPYLMMEYVPGGTLKGILAAQTQSAEQIDLARAASIMLDIAQGVRAVNERLIHRDIKPDNILVAEGRFKVADFGISKIVAERTRTRTFKGVGPITHMAPEAWLSETNTTKVDVYSVGLVFFELLTLHHPLVDLLPEGSDFERWRDAHLFEPIPDVRSVRPKTPLRLAQLLSRMTAKRPEDRPDWDEIISVISSSTEPEAEEPTTRHIVERAIARQREIEQQRLTDEREKNQSANLGRLYQASFQQLVSRFDAIVAEFNAQLQGAEIRKGGAGGQITYELPGAPKMSIRLFGRKETGRQISGGELIGGALLSLQAGASANLLLLREVAGDLYGRWLGCLVDLNALVDPQLSLRRLSAMPATVPFGFQSERDFYEHIVHASGGMHIFTYSFWTDVDHLFRELIDTAYTK